MKNLYIFATILELFGIALTTGGIAYEAVANADIGFIIITAGSVFIAAGSLLFAKVAPWLRDMRQE